MTGIQVETPKKECDDKNCPFHGDLSLRGSKHTGKVVSNDMEKSAVIRWEHKEKIEKYERFERRNTKITAHVPECINLEEGDEVTVFETKPISKTKSHVVVEVNEK